MLPTRGHERGADADEGERGQRQVADADTIAVAMSRCRWTIEPEARLRSTAVLKAGESGTTPYGPDRGRGRRDTMAE